MAFTRVQGAVGGASAASNTRFATFGAPVGVGNCVVGTVFYGGAITGIVSIKDDKGNNYNVIDTSSDATAVNACTTFVLGNILNGPTTVTFTGTGSDEIAIWLDEYSGVAPLSNPVDGAAHKLVNLSVAATTANAITSGTVTPVTNGCLIYGTAINETTALTAVAGTGFTIRQSQTAVVAPIYTEDQTQAARAAIAGTFTQSATTATRWFVGVIAILPAGVVIDAKSNFTAAQSVASFTNNTFTVGAGINRALLVALACEGVAPTAPTCNWDSTGANQAMTLIATDVDNRESSPVRIFLFGLVNPTAGLKTLSVAGLNTSTSSIIAYISFNGVDQTGGATTFKNSQVNSTGTGTVLTATVVTNAGDAALAMFSSNAGGATFNQTAWPSTQGTTSASVNGYNGNYGIASGASVALTQTQSTAHDQGFVATALNQLTAAAAPDVLMPQAWF